MEKADQHIKNDSRPGLEVLKNNYKDQEINNWDDLIDIFGKKYGYKEKKTWIFRGERDYESPLKTSLERAIEGLGEDKGKILYKDAQNILKFERNLMKEFKRKCHLFVSSPPQEDRFFEWMALMQHFGAPTRSLDWTYSFLIAVYFALENLKLEQEKCCVWAIDDDWIGDNFKSNLKNEMYEMYKKIFIKKEHENLEKREQIYKEIMIDKPKIRIYHANPARLNERLVIQQGIFLCPGDISKTFVENLKGDLSDSQDKIIRYIIPYKAREEILRNLYRMNINRATLFPGLDGFAKSLNLSLLYDLGKYDETSHSELYLGLD